MHTTLRTHRQKGLPCAFVRPSLVPASVQNRSAPHQHIALINPSQVSPSFRCVTFWPGSDTASSNASWPLKLSSFQTSFGPVTQAHRAGNLSTAKKTKGAALARYKGESFGFWFLPQAGPCKTFCGTRVRGRLRGSRGCSPH